MPTNVEIKARITDNRDEVYSKAAQLATGGPVQILHQEDTFFISGNGKLKLRTQKSEGKEDLSQLIFYDREDVQDLRVSNFKISLISDPNSVKEVLSLALGTRGIVRKTRNLYMIGQTRVHLDAVAGIGDFMELEVVLDDNQPIEEGKVIANDRKKKLGISSSQLISGTYLDHILNASN